MAAKTKPSNPLNGMHTAGIFSDMSIDGPDIGTLVLIVDRAKNLPNRKTIGKQDPYCAARLAKEAKKTTTDIRGGQTPKWDQELRFDVHDSPDYYQLKLSVFNDDRKTELIGETWIDLRDIIIRGGGQSDQWHSLTCKGKYAGEVRIEITYYDSRPKLEKPVAKPNVVATSSDPDVVVGSQKTVVKRRPLPSDPVTGQAPSPPVTEQVHTPPPRAQPNLPATFVSNPTPLQAIEYSTPPSNRPSNLPDQYVQAHLGANQYSTATHRAEHPQYRTLDRNYKFPTQENEHLRHLDPYSRSYVPDPRAPFTPGQSAYESPSALVHQPRQPVEDDDRPPPPPVHRVRNLSGSSQELVPRGAFDISQHKATPPMRHDVLRSEAHRYSVSSPSSSYPGRPTYRPFESAPEVQTTAQYHENEIHHQSAPRHYSYDSTYESHYRSMQPTVEDVPESWTPPSTRSRHSGSRALEYDERDLNQDSSPAPLNLGGRGSAGSGRYSHSPSPLPSQQQYESSGFSPSPEPMASEDYSQALTLVSRPYSKYNDHAFNHPSELDDNQVHTSGNYDLAPVPPTLVPGVDPALAREISDRFHQERTQGRRYTQPIPMEIPARGRQQSDPPSNYLVKYSPNTHHTSSSRSYERSVVPYSSAVTAPSAPAPISRPRGTSPNPSANYTIKRKSVSPAPPPSDGRRLSGVPFGPDSYDALNPTVASTKDASKSSEYTNASGKIVTSDGREVDPSDHLPMETWAPEPEPKKPVEPPQTRSRPIPAGAQPMPPSGRRPPRELTRPQSMAGLPTAYTTSEIMPSPPASTGRNRLQKKTHRASALPAPISSGSSPLGPSTPHQRNSTPPRALVRASTFDYENHGPGGARTGYGSGPPIPAKIPMMSGGLGPSSGRGDEEWALMEEMSRIDIGSGRARRHGGY
ncbi:hypothetical protein F4781DRAFT_380928 [Annulohypoxylon bovei var. microspora]|nr:hypothetical protein F4781DRAFT_380928 [Annulohypoxylon bovei var. microspora]